MTLFILSFGFIVLLHLSCYNIRRNSKERLQMENEKLTILLAEYDELRDELKQRISQRDNFSIQFIIAAAGILGVVYSSDGAYTNMLFLLPIISFYFASQIFSSYKVHDRLVEFIRENIEKQIADTVNEKEPSKLMWESYCQKTRKIEFDNKIGGRKHFFQVILMATPLVSLAIYLSFNTSIAMKILAAFYFFITEFICVFYAVSNSNKYQYFGLNKLSFVDYIDKKPRTDEVNKAIFLDRDGTLHEDRVMTHKLKDLKLLPGAKEFVKKAHDKGFKIIIVTNQSAIGKGYYTIRQMHWFNTLLRKKLKFVDAIYFCPHTAEAHCRCRKPDAGMFERAAKEFNIDMTQSVIVGDRMSDLIAGDKAGISRKIFVTTGVYGEGGYKAEKGFDTLTHETVDSLTDVIL